MGDRVVEMVVVGTAECRERGRIARRESDAIGMVDEEPDIAAPFR
jgi:hypothetical protein